MKTAKVKDSEVLKLRYKVKNVEYKQDLQGPA